MAAPFGAAIAGRSRVGAVSGGAIRRRYQAALGWESGHAADAPCVRSAIEARVR